MIQYSWTNFNLWSSDAYLVLSYLIGTVAKKYQDINMKLVFVVNCWIWYSSTFLGNWRWDCESVFNVTQMIFLDMTDFHQLEQSNKKSSPESEDWFCSYCDQTFESTDILKWHLYTIHNVEGMCSLWKYIHVGWKGSAILGKKQIITFTKLLRCR